MLDQTIIAVGAGARRTISFEITDEITSGHKVVWKLLNDAKIDDASMDLACGREDACKFLKKGVYMPGINPRKDVIVMLNTIKGEPILAHHKFGRECWNRTRK
jgi:hypothetical protein